MTDPYAISEDELQAEVRKLCNGFGLRVVHYPDSRSAWKADGRKEGQGDPDLRIYGRKLLHVELKSEDGRQSRDQQRFERDVLAAGLEYRLWRPSHLIAGIIRRELEGLR